MNEPINIPIEPVSALLREVADTTVLPKFSNLDRDEVEEKSPGEIVTAVDREAEELLSTRLLSLLPGSRVVGEEATAKTPGLLDGLDQGLVWLVDPIDGTANYAAGGFALRDHDRPSARWRGRCQLDPSTRIVQNVGGRTRRRSLGEWAQNSDNDVGAS